MSNTGRCLKCGGRLARKRLEQDPRYCSVVCNWWDLRAEIARLSAKIEALEKDSRLLKALRAHGVDNWDGWDDAIESLEVRGE